MIDGLKMKHRAAIIDALAANERVERAILFGSRATETYTTASDIDIALIGDRLTLADQVSLNAVMEALTVPQRVDLLLYTMIDNDALRKNIDRQGVEWYCRQASERSELPCLLPPHRAALETVLRKHLPGIEAWICGCSRGNDDHDGNNLDLVLCSGDQREIPDRQLTDLRQALRDSSLFPLIKVYDWASLPKWLRSEVERNCLVLVGKTRPDSG